MNDDTLTKDQLVDELRRLRQQLAEMRQAEKKGQQAEEALAHERALRELEQRVAERTAELTTANAALRDQILERERAEQQWRNTQSLYQSLVQNLPMNVLRKDREGRFTFGNVFALQTMGKTLEELLGRTDFDFFPEPLANKYCRDDRRVMQTGEVFEDVEKHHSPQGQDLHVHVLKTPVRDAKEEIIGVQVLFWDVTDREQAKQQLAYERDLFQKLMDGIPDSIYFKDRQSRFVKCSRAVARQFLIEDANLLVGKTDFDLFTEEHARPAFEDEQQIIRTGQAIVGKLEKETYSDGRVSWALTTKMPWRDEQGRIIGTFGITKDVTAVKRAEEALAYEREQFRAFLENIPDSVYFKDRQSRFVRISRAQAERFHLTEADLAKGKTDFDFFTEEHARPAFEDEQGIMRTGQAVIGKLEKEVYPDGRVTWALTTKMPWRDRQGTIIGTFGVSKDVTELKRTEEALAQASSLLQTLLDHVPDRIYFKDLQSRFIRCSKAVVEPLGMKNADEAIGKSDFDFFQEEHARPAFEDEQRIIRTGEPVIAKEEKEVWQDGQVTWVLTNKLPLHDKGGKIIGTFGISKDITQLKLAEERIEQVHRQLLEVSRRAGMADVATGVLHNVGNILNSINVSTNLLVEQVKASRVHSAAKLADLFEEHAADLRRFLTEDQRGRQVPAYLKQLAGRLREEQGGWLRELESLVRNVDHIKEIVAMQQSYARVSGVTETVPVRELVEDALKMHSGAYLRHAVNLVREYEEVPPITVDKHKVLQILVNLLSNAKYACDEGGPAEKRVTVRIAPAADDRVKIEVADNGVGIPPENLTKVFGHGFTTRRSGHGFGLHSGALAAKELGGTLTASSPGPGQGATFVLDLPLVPPESNG
jgi:PAS domain S-box-containing protein